MDSIKRKILIGSESLEEQMIHSLKEIVKIRSYSGLEGTANNPDTVAGKIYRVMKNLNLEVYAQDITFADGHVSQNIIGIVKGKSRERSLIVNSHMDIVPEGIPSMWHKSQPFSAVEGAAEYLGESKIRLELDGESYEEEIRKPMAEVWDKRKVKRKEMIYGRGSYDDKGGLVSMIYSAGLLSSILEEEGTQLNGDLIVACTVDEERGSAGTKLINYWLKDHGYLKGELPPPPDIVHKDIWGVIVEGSLGFKPVVGHRGAIWYVIRTMGKPCHASTPQLGKNAVEAMCKVLSGLSASQSALVEKICEFTISEMLGKPSFAIGTTIVGGGIKGLTQVEGSLKVDRSGVNIIPDWCEATMDVRYGIGREHPKDLLTLPERITNLIEKAIREMSGGEERVQVEPIKESLMYPIALGRDFHESRKVELVSKALRAAEAVLGYDPGLGVVPGGTDAPIMRYNAGIPTLAEWGPAGGFHHEYHEYVEKDQVVDGMKIFALFAYDFLK